MLTEWTFRRFWAGNEHPYRRLSRRLGELVSPGKLVVDAGCGHTAPNLQELRHSGAELVGVDLVPLEPQPGLRLVESDIAHLPVADESVDVLYSRSVMEHVADPDAVFGESRRVLAPDGRWVFLTANRWDYVSLVARLVPNRFHGAIVNRCEGRAVRDIFPTAYRANDFRQIERYASAHGLRIVRCEYLDQYPAIFYRVGPLFFLATLYHKLVMRLDLFTRLRGWLFVELVKV